MLDTVTASLSVYKPYCRLLSYATHLHLGLVSSHLIFLFQSLSSFLSFRHISFALLPGFTRPTPIPTPSLRLYRLSFSSRLLRGAWHRAIAYRGVMGGSGMSSRCYSSLAVSRSSQLPRKKRERSPRQVRILNAQLVSREAESKLRSSSLSGAVGRPISHILTTSPLSSSSSYVY